MLLSGCGLSRTGTDSRSPTLVESRAADDRYEAVAASSLVFAPPITLNEPTMLLDRASRQPAAYAGYDEGSTEYYRISVDDRQVAGGADNWRPGHGWFGSSSGYADRYERRVQSERVGAVRR